MYTSLILNMFCYGQDRVANGFVNELVETLLKWSLYIAKTESYGLFMLYFDNNCRKMCIYSQQVQQVDVIIYRV